MMLSSGGSNSERMVHWFGGAMSSSQSLYNTFPKKRNDFTKGQIISEQNCGVLNFPNIQLNIARISALATKMGQMGKIKAHYHAN